MRRGHLRGRRAFTAGQRRLRGVLPAVALFLVVGAVVLGVTSSLPTPAVGPRVLSPADGGALAGLSGPAVGASAGATMTAADKAALVTKADKLRAAGLGGTSRLASDIAGGVERRPRVMVKVAPHVATLDDLVDATAGIGLRVDRVIEPLDVWVVEVTDGSPVEGVVERLAASPGVVWAEASRERVLGRYVPDDPYYSAHGGWPGQWGPPAVFLEDAWETTTGSGSVTLAVVDSGIARDIPDFEGRIVSPYSTLYDTDVWPAWEDIVGHGSGVAGVAAATGDDGYGIAGADWQCDIMPVHVSDELTLYDDDLIDGIVYAVDAGADVINVSACSSGSSLTERNAIDYALASGVSVVAAVGNEGPADPVGYPAAYDGVIAVGSVDMGLSRSSFSNRGTALDLMAPGEGVLTWSADTVSIYLALMDGTSFSTPFVAGVASLMLSVNPDLSPSDMETILRETAVDLATQGFDQNTGYGLLDAALAVTTAEEWEPVEPLSFADVPATHPYAQAIYKLAYAGAISGYGNGYFGVNDPVTRQQFSKMILLALRQTPSDGMFEPFVDVETVPGTTYPDDFIALAYELGITTGVSVDPPLYGPGRNISRAQVVTMAVRAADRMYPGWLAPAPAGYLPPFGRFSPVHDGPAATAAYNGLLSGLMGMGPGYDMWRTATRGEVAVILAPLLATGEE